MAESTSGHGEHPRVLLSAFLDDELDDHQSAWVATHVVACDQCGEQLERLRSARQALRGLPDVTVPDAVLADVATAAEDAGSARRRRRQRALAGAGVVGALAGVLVAAFVAGRPEGDVTPPVEMFVVDHVVQHGGGPMIVPVDLNDR